MSTIQKNSINSYRIARLASVDESQRPLVVPVCFVYDGEFIYTPIDNKPKGVSANKLKRIRNILHNPNVSLLIDDYYEDWSRLHYLIIHGSAELLHEGDEYHNSLALLCSKYNQYKDMGLEQLGLPVIKITPYKTKSWGDL